MSGSLYKYTHNPTSSEFDYPAINKVCQAVQTGRPDHATRDCWPGEGTAINGQSATGVNWSAGCQAEAMDELADRLALEAKARCTAWSPVTGYNLGSADPLHWVAAAVRGKAERWQ